MTALRALLVRCAALPAAVRAAAALLWAAAIWVLSSRPALPSPGGALAPLLHNGAHVVVFAVLGALVLLALHDGAGGRPRAVLASTLAGAWGVVDELHQSFVPIRTASAGDVVADVSGAVLGVALTVWLWRGEARAARVAAAALPVALLAVGVETFLR